MAKNTSNRTADAKTVNLRINAELLERVDAIAEERMVSRTYLIHAALEAFLPTMPPLPEVRVHDVTQTSTAHASHTFLPLEWFCDTCGASITSLAVEQPCPTPLP